MSAPFRLVTTFSSTMITCILEQLYPFQLWFGGVSQKFSSFPALTGGTKGWHNSDRCSTCNDSVRHFGFRRCASKGAKKGSLKYRFSDTVFLTIIFYEEKSSLNFNSDKLFQKYEWRKHPKKTVKLCEATCQLVMFLMLFSSLAPGWKCFWGKNRRRLVLLVLELEQLVEICRWRRRRWWWWSPSSTLPCLHYCTALVWGRERRRSQRFPRLPLEEGEIEASAELLALLALCLLYIQRSGRVVVRGRGRWTTAGSHPPTARTTM